MSSYLEHRDAALDLLDQAYEFEWGEPSEAIAYAQVHATLALAAAVAGNDTNPHADARQNGALVDLLTGGSK